MSSTNWFLLFPASYRASQPALFLPLCNPFLLKYSHIVHTLFQETLHGHNLPTKTKRKVIKYDTVKKLHALSEEKWTSLFLVTFQHIHLQWMIAYRKKKHPVYTSSAKHTFIYKSPNSFTPVAASIWKNS